MPKAPIIKSRSNRSLPFSQGAGYREFFHEDPVTGQWTIETVDDITGIIETNKSLYASVDERARFAGYPSIGNHVASIPNAILYDPKYKHLLEDQEALRKFLNDSDNQFMRTRPGRI